MAGVQAGSAFNVSIDFIAKMVTLQNDLDKMKRAVGSATGEVGRMAKAANDNLSSIGRGAGTGLQQFSREVARIKGQLDPAWAALQRYKQEVALLSQAYRQGAITQAQYTQGLMQQRAAWKAGGDTVVKSSGAQRAGLQQLTMQLGDVSTMYALGARPMQIFASQSGQVVQAISLASGGAGKFAAFMGGPWGIAITGAALVLAPLIAKLFDTTDALDEVGDAAQQALAKLRQSMAEVSTAQAAITSNHTKMINAMGAVAAANRDIAQTTRLMNEMVTMPGGANAMEGLSARLARAEASRSAAQKQLDEAKAGLDEIAALSGVQEMRDRNQAALSERAGRAHRERAAGLSDEAKALIKATDAANDYLKSLQDENARFGKNAVELKRMEVAAQAAAAAKLGLTQTSLDIIKAGDLAVANMRKEAQTRYDTQIKSIANEIKLLGLAGAEREKAALAFEEEGFRAQAAADGIANVTAAWQAYHAVRTQQIDAQSALDRDTDAAERARAEFQRLNDELLGTISNLQQIGGAGSALGNALAFVTGNFGALSGPLGGILTIDFDPIMRGFRDLGDAFKGGMSSLGSVLVSAIQSAGIGAAGAASIMGKQGTKGMIGGALGGIAGGALASSVAGSYGFVALQATISNALGGAIGSALGSALPVIGTILGGLAGTALTKLLSGTPRGSAIISGGQVSGYYGGNKQFEQQAGELAGGVLDTLQRIADQFGATLNEGAGKVSIGLRNGSFYVDPKGRGYTNTSKYGDVQGFGKDQEAAVKAAILNLIEDGVITGLREGTMKLLRSGGDLEQQLAKALAFEQVFKEIDQAASPFVAQLDALKAQFDQLKAVFKEAGASAEDYAALQAYLAKQQQALIDQMMSNYRSTFYTEAENAAFAQQQIAAVLGPLGYGNVDTVKEYRALVEVTDALANPELYGALMSLVDAFGTLKAAEEQAAAAAQAAKVAREAQREAERQERERAIDAARSALRQAYDREASALTQTIERFGGLADSLAEFRKELFAGEQTATSYAQRLAELRRVGNLAALGDEASLGAFPGVGNAFLATSRNSSRTLLQYQRDVALVARYAATGEAASRGMVTEAQKQLAALDKQVGALVAINDNVLSVEQAIRDLIKLQGGGSSSGGTRVNPIPDWFGRGENDNGFGFGLGGFSLGRRRLAEPMWDQPESADGGSSEARVSEAMLEELGLMRMELRATAKHTQRLAMIWEDAEAEGGGFLVQSNT